MSDLEKARELGIECVERVEIMLSNDYTHADTAEEIGKSIQAALSQARREGFEKAKEMAWKIAENVGRRWHPGEAARASCFVAGNLIRALQMEEENAV